MTCYLPSVAPIAILRADHPDNMKRESASLHTMETNAESNLLPQLFTKIRFLFFTLKIAMAERILQLVLGHKSTFSSDCQLFWLNHISFILKHSSQLLTFCVASNQTWVQQHFDLNVFVCFIILNK